VELTQKIVHELLDYTPHTGTLRWRKRDRKWFTSDSLWKIWNRRFAGKPALAGRNTNGHLFGRILRRNYLSHRVIWLWMTGDWPHPEIDHKNRNRTDNRWANLREATRIQNMRNQSMSKINNTGQLGVQRLRGKWQATIGIGGRHYHYLGVFPTFVEAVAARVAAERQYGYSLGHGRTQRRPMPSQLLH